MTLTSHHKRIATGLILLVVLGVLLACGGWPLRVAVMLVACLGLWEFLGLYWPRPLFPGRKAVTLVFGCLIVGAQAVSPFWVSCALCLAFVAVALMFLCNFGLKGGEARFGHYAPMLSGLLYIPFLLQLGLYLTPAEQCMALGAAIVSDIGGYYAGSLWGRKKFWPIISPKKTWAGFYGGLGLCAIWCMLLGGLGGLFGWPLLSLPLWAWLLVAVALHEAAVFGDLFESALKRSLNVKDSGNILPGHGGVLDRVDSILLILPVYLCLREALAWGLPLLGM
jgi:phosphatidate cytidylyltransferase